MVCGLPQVSYSFVPQVRYECIISTATLSALFHKQGVRISCGRDSDRNLESEILFESFQVYEANSLVFAPFQCKSAEGQSRPPAVFL
jgi:hypothetical protein